MPALRVKVIRLPFEDSAPHLKTGNVGEEHVGARRAKALSLREDRRHQQCRYMIAERVVVVIQCMSRGGTVQRREADGHSFLAKQGSRLSGAGF